MPQFPARLESRLPGVSTTIFTVMSRLAQECGAINLSQGFPDFAPPRALTDALARHGEASHHQYAPMAGAPALREALAAQYALRHCARYDPEHEITITAGATQALFCAIGALVHPGDEVIVFEPVYDSYVPAIELVGARARRARLRTPHYRPDWDEVRALLGPRTRMVIVNTPHNPTGSVWSAHDLAQLAALLRDTDAVVLADEVYEHIVFDGRAHASVAAHAALAERSVVVGSFGKTFHATGWKVGYTLAPRELTAELRKLHQYVVFAVNHPAQLALAEVLGDASWCAALPAFYQDKRDLFRSLLAGSRLEPLDCAGTYFQCVRYGAISDEPDTVFAQRLAREHRVAAIPVSAFAQHWAGEGVLRFCFAKQKVTLEAAAERLRRV